MIRRIKEGRSRQYVLSPTLPQRAKVDSAGTFQPIPTVRVKPPDFPVLADGPGKDLLLLHRRQVIFELTLNRAHKALRLTPDRSGQKIKARRDPVSCLPKHGDCIRPDQSGIG